jgi:hypothetical protein
VRGATARSALRSALRAHPSSDLATQSSKSGDCISVDLLTGHGFWAESIATARSLSRAVNLPLAYHFHDDGSLQPREITAIRRWIPGATVHTSVQAETRIAAEFPESRFPIVHRLRRANVLVRKLIDVAAAGRGWRLFIDSDVLFFRRAAEVETLLRARRAFHLTDCDSYYDAPVESLSRLAGCSVFPRVNTGLYYHNFDQIDWQFVEHAFRRQLVRHGYSYFIEQALQAVLLARGGAVPLGSEYLVLPTPEECEKPTRVLHHYVNQSRWGFYVNARRQLRALQNA